MGDQPGLPDTLDRRYWAVGSLFEGDGLSPYGFGTGWRRLTGIRSRRILAGSARLGMEGSMDFALLSLLVLDVDGVLTPGTIAMTPDGELDKSFYVRDGLAIGFWQRSGGVVALLTGRGGKAVTRRAKELGIMHVVEGVADKAAGFEALLSMTGRCASQAVYMGDDLADLGPMERAGLAVAVGDAAPTVKRTAAFITRAAGGRGAVAELIEFVLRKQHRWREAMKP